MSHYKPYPAYKDSGVEWLGKVPEHWVAKKLMYWISTGYGSGTTPSEDSDYTDEETGIAWVTTGELRENTIEKTEKHISYAASKKYSALKVHPTGSLIIAMYGATIGRLGVLNISATLNQACFAIHPTEHIQIPYLRYWFEGFRRELIELGTGGGQPNVSADKIRNLLIPAPSSRSEQIKLTRHLDRETTRIDTLIAKKTRFIELLKEKRQALITQAVTKGLNPNVKMKDSGVEWLGEVPEHWGVQAIKLIASVGNGCTPNRENKQYWENGFYPWLTSTLVNLNEVRKAEEFITQVALDECSLPKIPPPAVLIGLTGQGRTRGMATTLYIEATISQHIAYIKPIKKHIEIEYLRSAMDSVYLFLRDESDGGGSTKGAVTCDQIKSLKIPIPPINEQISIAEFIRESTERITSVTEKTQLSITLLKERRSALITAAVTGQIDLREAA